MKAVDNLPESYLFDQRQKAALLKYQLSELDAVHSCSNAESTNAIEAGDRIFYGLYET